MANNIGCMVAGWMARFNVILSAPKGGRGAIKLEEELFRKSIARAHVKSTWARCVVAQSFAEY